MEYDVSVGALYVLRVVNDGQKNEGEKRGEI